MSNNPSLEQFIAAQQGKGRAAAKTKWYQFGRAKVTKEEKLKRRFEGDTRPYTERNAHHRKTANGLSYFFQLASISGAAYGAYRLFWSWDIQGIAITMFALTALFFYERLARWTSDKFWDERAAGRFDLRFAFLNFGVIWSVGAMLTVGGMYYFSNDTATGPGGSASTNDPAYIAMSKELSDAKASVTKAEGRVASFKKDPNNLTKSNGKTVVMYRRLPTLSKLEAAVVTAEARVTTVSEQMKTRFGVIAMYDAEQMAYWQTVKASKVWAQMGMFLIFLVLFEVCMWYRSKYDMMEYWETLYSRSYGRKPHSDTRKLKARRGKFEAPTLTP